MYRQSGTKIAPHNKKSKPSVDLLSASLVAAFLPHDLHETLITLGRLPAASGTRVEAAGAGASRSSCLKHEAMHEAVEIECGQRHANTDRRQHGGPSGFA